MFRQRNRGGVTIVLYALAMFTLMLCLGLALDGGYLYTQKGAGQLTEDIIALIVLGSTDRSLTPAQQQAYIVDQVNRLEVANGLKMNFYTRRTEQNSNGDVTKLILNAPNPLKTVMLNLIGIGQVNVGLEAIAVRGFVTKRIRTDCSDGSSVGIFGCVRVQVQGNPMVDSYKSSIGSYASQAVNLGCGASNGGLSNHLGTGGHGGHGESNYALRHCQAMSNRLVTMQGSFCYHGPTLSSLDTNVQGGGYLDGKATTEYFTGDASLVAEGVQIQSVPDLNLTKAVGSASAAVNDNGAISGGVDTNKLLSPNYQLKATGSNHEILFTAGKKYYFKDIDLSGATTIRITGDPRTAGPVEITLDGDAKWNGNVTSDVQPTRPGWLRVVGINGCSECCEGCQSSGVGHRGGHGHHYLGTQIEEQTRGCHSSQCTKYNCDGDHRMIHGGCDIPNCIRRKCNGDHTSDAGRPCHSHHCSTPGCDGNHSDGHGGCNILHCDRKSCNGDHHTDECNSTQCFDADCDGDHNDGNNHCNIPNCVVTNCNGDHRVRSSSLPESERLFQPQSIEVGSLPHPDSGYFLLGSLGVMPSSQTPAWMAPGALNLACGLKRHYRDCACPRTEANDQKVCSSGDGGPTDPNCDPSKDHSIKFAGNAQVFMDFYGPGYNFDTQGTSDFYGRVYAEEVQIRGNSSFHYDEDLGTCIEVVETDTGDAAKVHLIN